MIQIRKAEDRGHANHGWLDTYHTFSFATCQDPEHTKFRSRRVMNEEFVAAGQRLGTHPHHDMEIVTYVLEGALEHKDPIGNGEVLRSGEFQRMSAGTGITHSEFNPSSDEPVHLYQIWLFPEQKGIDRHAWLHVATGKVIVNGSSLGPGDAVATSRPTALQVEGNAKAEALLFDLG